MAEQLNLDNEHPDFAETSESRIKCRDLYGGSDVVKTDSKSETYLYSGTDESTDDYEIRRLRAVLDPWVEKIITARQALLFSKLPVRELPAKLKPYLEDVDRKGTSAEVFFADTAQEAQIDGIHWVLIDAPPAPEGRYLNKLAEDLSGHRPFFQHIPALCVLDWEVDDDGALLWAVVKQQRVNNRGEDGWGVADEAIDQWKIWTRGEWFLYEELEQPVEGKKYNIVDQGVNSSGVVPLVPFFGVRKTDYSGWPVCRAVADHIIQIYNKDSDLDWFERLVSHPIPYFIGPDKPENLDTSKGFFVKSADGDGKIEVGLLEPTGTGFASIRESIQDLRYRILSIALAQAKKDSGQVQSGDGQREDRKIFAASVRTAAQGLESSESRCWDIMAKWCKESGKINIEYNRDYDDRMIDAVMLGAMTDLVMANMLPYEDFLQALKEAGFVPPSFDVDAAIAHYEESQARLPEPMAVPAIAGEEEDEGEEDETA